MLDIAPVSSNSLIQVLIVVSVSVASVTDIRTRRIPNALTFPAITLGLIVNGIVSGADGVLRALAGFGLGVALFIIPVAFMGRGAGDLKLLAALGALGGPAFVFWCALFTSIAGGIFAVAALIARRRFTLVAGGMALDLYTLQLPQATSNIRLPYALPIAVGAVATMVLR
jgi:prepilin peptidase CpaA